MYGQQTDGVKGSQYMCKNPVKVEVTLSPRVEAHEDPPYMLQNPGLQAKWLTDQPYRLTLGDRKES